MMAVFIHSPDRHSPLWDGDRRLRVHPYPRPAVHILLRRSLCWEMIETPPGEVGSRSDRQGNATDVVRRSCRDCGHYHSDHLKVAAAAIGQKSRHVSRTESAVDLATRSDQKKMD